MGDVAVPSAALWQAQTQRAVQTFRLSGEPLTEGQVHALAWIKLACARVNARLGVLPPDVAAAIERAAEEVAAGAHPDAFPVDVFQTGSGTSSHMNMNEVLATLATRSLGRTVHPNDDVNASQSSNDVFPTSVHVAALVSGNALLDGLTVLEKSLRLKSVEFADYVKPGRTHLMDAVPVTLGGEFGGYATQIHKAAQRISGSLTGVGEIPLGGTAVGTGLNAPAGWREQAVAELAAVTGLSLRAALDGYEAQASRDALVELSGQLRCLAVSLTKICSDLRLMGSGPTAGLGELHLPDLQPGSSIMPGKVNPVVPEAVLQVCGQVVGNDAAVAWGGAAGSFELNAMLPVIGRNLLSSLHLLNGAVRLLADRCVDGLTAERAELLRRAEAAPAIVTALNSLIGYEEAAAVAKSAVAQGLSIAEVVVQRGHLRSGRLTRQQLDTALDVARMAGADQARESPRPKG